MSESEKPSVGARLRERRREFGMTLAEAAEKTRIRRAYLEALEADRFDALPGEAYLKGFLRSYAGLLKLDPEALLERSQDRVGETPAVAQDVVRRRSAAPARRDSAKGGGKRSRVAAALLGVLAVLVAALPLLLKRGPEPGVGLPTEERLAAPAPSPSPIEPRLLPVPASGTTIAPAAAELAGAPAASSPTIPGVSPSAGPAGSPAGPALMPDRSSPAPTIPAGGAVLRLEANGPVRIELTIDNRPPRRYDLKTDSSLSWRIGRSVRISIDNPAAVRLWLGERPLDLAGRSEIILRGVEEERREEDT
jgi:cytoskeleton protein RodZ